MFVRRADAHTKHSKNETAHSQGSAVGKTFFSGVLVLTLSTVLVKIIGLFYKIPMLRYLGSVGMGYFNAAYEWYAMLCVITTAGLPIAVSMLISKENSQQGTKAMRARAIRRIERLSMRIFLIFGLIGSVVLFFGAGFISDLIDSPMTVYALRAVAPTMFFSCVSASYRGYFQGFQNMKPTAISQLIEAVGKLVLGIAFAHLAKRAGMDEAHIAAFAMLGLSLGVAIACLYLAIYRARYTIGATSSENVGHDTRRPLTVRATSPLLRQLLTIAVPVTLSSSVLSLTKIVDMAMILRCLQEIGYTTEEANALYGIYTTMAVPIFNLVPALLTSVSLALIPTLSAQISVGDHQAQKDTVSAAMRLTALLSLPASLALALYSRPVLSLLFHPDMQDLASAAPMLSLLAVSVAFSGMITTTNATLQAFGQVRVPIVSMLFGSAVKLLSAYILISQPDINILGAPISTLLCNSVIVGINLQVLYRRTGVGGEVNKTLLQPLAVSLPSVGIPAAIVAYLIKLGFDERILFVSAVPLTILLLAALSLRFGIVGVRELSSTPIGLRLKRVAMRLPFCRKIMKRIE
ncbi:MAG: polysaccharide biosynthesis protein [Clostridia bacterium]|nr:polysaccharide biosynthesis protein [Clostridia bacterium]